MSPRIRKSSRTVVFAGGIVAVALLAASCGADDPDVAGPPVAPQDSAANGEADHTDFSFGEAADAADADRVIEIDAADNLSFDPDTVEVTVGEIVTFRISNVGKLPHDFTLGDSDTQDDHDAEMAEMGDMAMEDTDPNATTVPAGETRELTWMFTEAGQIIMGCHVPGHYAAGMRGDITITDPS